jgi:hypothetical protein
MFSLLFLGWGSSPVRHQAVGHEDLARAEGICLAGARFLGKLRHVGGERSGAHRSVEGPAVSPSAGRRVGALKGGVTGI